MEKGNWGHNSTFVEEQTHVPLVIHVPGMQPGTVSALTSHLDIPATLLRALGAENDSRDYSQGMSLLQADQGRFINMSDWHSIAFMTEDLKIRIPYINTGFDNWQPTDTRDMVLDQARARELLDKYAADITTAISNTSTFTR